MGKCPVKENKTIRLSGNFLKKGKTTVLFFKSVTQGGMLKYILIYSAVLITYCCLKVKIN